MAGPHYPHPDADAVPVRETFVGARIDVDATKMTGLPKLDTLHDNILEWLRSYLGPNANFARDFGPTGAGKVLIVSDGQEHGTYVQSAKVLNGAVRDDSYHAPYGRWVNDMQQDFDRNPKKLSKVKGFRPDDYATRVWDFSGEADLVGNACSSGDGGTNNAYTDKNKQVVYINAHLDDGSVLVHEFFHAVEGRDQKQADFGLEFDEGIVDFFARDVSKAYNYSYKGNIGYNGGYMAAKAIVDRLGLPFLCRLWFVRPADWLRDLGPTANTIAMKRKIIYTAQDAANLADVTGEVNQFCTLAQAKLQAAQAAGQLPQVPVAVQPAGQLPLVPAAVQPAAQLPHVPAAVRPARKWPQVPALNKPFRSGG